MVFKVEVAKVLVFKVRVAKVLLDVFLMNSELPHQAVPGVGPQAQTQHNRELHPSLARKTGCAGSLLSTGSDSSVSAATDVWYFSIGLTSTNKPTTMPERTTISDKRPNPKIFPYLGCSLCG